MERGLDCLSADFYPKACEWLARCAARGIPLFVVQTRRTLAEHQANLASGASGTTLSLHLPRSLRWRNDLALLDPSQIDKADAMDVVPYRQFDLYGPDKLQWDGSDPAFSIIGEEAERVGLRWGGRWKSPYDPGHAELVLPWKVAYLAAERARPWPTFRTA